MYVVRYVGTSGNGIFARMKSASGAIWKSERKVNYECEFGYPVVSVDSKKMADKRRRDVL